MTSASHDVNGKDVKYEQLSWRKKQVIMSKQKHVYVKTKQDL